MSFLNPNSKLLWCGDRVKEWLETGSTRPTLIEISPTGYCNASCPWCFFKEKNSGEKIETNKLIKALTDLKNLGVKAINWTGGGEPVLHPDFKYFITHAHALGFKQGLFTNGYQETPHADKFSWIRISMTDKGFKAIKKPKVPFGVCLNHLECYSQYELKCFCQGAKDLGAAYFQIRPALFKDQPELDIPVYLKDFETDNFKVELTEYKYKRAIEPRGYDHCYGFHFCPSLNWRGEFNTCMYFANDSRFILGSIYEDSVEDIFNRMKFVKVCGDCQRACKLDMINLALDEAKKTKQVEFL